MDRMLYRGRHRATPVGRLAKLILAVAATFAVAFAR